MNPEKEKLKKLIKSGEKIAGPAVGAAVGSFGGGLIGGPVGAAVGSVIGTATEKILRNIVNTLMSQREEEKIGAVAVFALERINERLKNNENPRNDSFFHSKTGSQSSGEQLFEGVLLKARNEYEEKKLKYLGLFYANLAFTEKTSPATAYLLLKIMERLTYRQMIMLSLIKREGHLNVESLRRPEHSDPELEALKREEMDLHSSDLGNFSLVRGYDLWRDKLSPLGEVLLDLADLNHIPDSDINLIRNLLVRCGGPENPIILGSIN